ncbi:MAG: hypothetical protein HFF18_00140 [Oscillospiraceae bacterium]|nr:hypothetical protein [Oscillospiraceae bacterium]
MDEKDLEEIVLEKLERGLLDGPVGDDFVTGDYSKVIFRKVIRDGIPQTLRIGEGYKFFDNRENTRVPGTVQITEAFETISQKLLFLQKYGWLLDDPDVREYSRRFKDSFRRR